MKTLIMALVALSVVTGIAPVANAFDSKSFYEQQDRSRRQPLNPNRPKARGRAIALCCRAPSTQRLKRVEAVHEFCR